MTSKSTLTSQVTPEFQKIGEILSQARAVQGLEVLDVAHALIMSTAQIRGMETTELNAFHNAQFFTRGVEKYARHLAIPEENELWSLLSQIRQSLSHPKANPTRQEVTALVKSGFFKNKTSVWAYFARHPVFWVFTITMAAFGINLNARLQNENARHQELSLEDRGSAPAQTLASGLQNQATISAQIVTHPDSTAMPPADAAPLLSTPAALVTQSTDLNGHAAVADASTPEIIQSTPAVLFDPAASEIQVKNMSRANLSKITLKFNGPSWVQYISKDGTVNEKVYQPEDVLEVDPSMLDSMTIGNAGATTLKAGNTLVDLNLHSSNKNGVARLKQEDFTHMVN